MANNKGKEQQKNKKQAPMIVQHTWKHPLPLVTKAFFCKFPHKKMGSVKSSKILDINFVSPLQIRVTKIKILKIW